MKSLWFSVFCVGGLILSALAEPPNIVFFIADDMTPNMFNCLPEGRGQNLTPNIDRLAAEGVMLMGQHVVSPVCTPSRYNCLTGKYASRATNAYFKECTKKNEGQTVVDFNSHLEPGNTTLPMLLQKAGYKTGLSGKDHVMVMGGGEHFSDYEADSRSPEIAAKLKADQKRAQQTVRAMGFDYAASVYAHNPAGIGLRDMASHNMDWITKGGLDFIDECGKKPFYLYMATTIPHGPSNAKQSWNADPLVTAAGFLDEPLAVQPPRHTIPERLKAAGLPVNNRTANMLWLDDGLGALLDRLEVNGQLDNTIIFFFNDHGQNAKGTLYQGGIHNPSIVWKKGGFACGGTNDALLSNVDFAPTILDLVGAEYDPKPFDGESFLPYLNGKKQPPNRELYHELGYARAIRKGDWKYIAVRYPEKYETMSLKERTRVLEEWNAWRKRIHQAMVTDDPTRPFSHLTAIPGGAHAESYSTGENPNYFDRDQLYNLADDPTEQMNLAGHPEYADQLAELKRILQKKINELDGHFDLSAIAPTASIPAGLDLLGDAVAASNITAKGSTTQIVDYNGQESLRMVFEKMAPMKWPRVGLEKGWDLSGYAGIEAKLTNMGTAAGEILLRVDNVGQCEGGPWNTTMASQKVAPGESITLRVEFGYNRFKSGRESGYALDASKISQILFSMPRPEQDQVFRLDGLSAFK